MADDVFARIKQAELEARRVAAIAREKGLSSSGDVAPAALPKTRADAPLRPSAGGERLVRGTSGWLLEGREVRAGDVLEVYTNAANGWLRGRLAWAGGGTDAARLVVNLWDANGARDADGTPPLVGELDAAIPPGAICRLPVK